MKNLEKLDKNILCLLKNIQTIDHRLIIYFKTKFNYPKIFIIYILYIRFFIPHISVFSFSMDIE